MGTRKQRFRLGIAITLAVIVLFIATFLLLPVIDGDTDTPREKEYVQIEDVVGKSLTDVKTELDGKGIAFEIIQDDSAKRGKVSKIEFSGDRSENMLNIEKGTSVKLYANEKGLNGKTVYITIDDGPTNSNTMKILDTLDKYDIKATFFLQGQNIEKQVCKGLTEEIIKRGHLVGCHSYSHSLSDIYSSSETMTAEIKKYENALIKIFGDEKFEKMPKLFRFPGGSVQNGKISREQSKEYIAAIENMGYSIYDWNCLIADGEIRKWDKGSESEEEYNAYVSKFMRSKFEQSLAKAENSDEPIILLLHDKWTATDEGITVDGKQFWDWMIETLIEKGYVFDTLKDVPPYFQ